MTVSAFILSYAITKGMKSYGPKGILTQKTKPNQSLIACQINSIKDIVSDISVVTGFGREKITKKITDITTDIYNDKYETANEGYAISKLLLDNQIDSALILCDGIILGLKTENLINSNSVIFVTNRTKKSKFNLGCIVDKQTNLLEHIFYDISDTVWCEAVLLKKNELNIIQHYIKNNFIENMFLFELINESIKLGAKYATVKLLNKNVKKIECIKDANHIKEVNI
jgi:hypothetical protein